MDPKHISTIASELSITEKQVTVTLGLLDEGGTVPFISRYRKEMTGSLDEVQVAGVRDRSEQLRELDKRREAILKSIKEQEKLTPELEQKILAAATMTVLEDLYLPYKPKKRTRGTVAKEKGLEPLAKLLFEQKDDVDPQAEAEKYINEKLKVDSVQAALNGAQDIIAEWVNEDAAAREKIRALFMSQGVFRSTVIRNKEQEGAKYKDYFDLEELVSKAPSHRVLAMRRGEKEHILLLRVVAPEDQAHDILDQCFVKAANASADVVKDAIRDSYKRLLSLSIENEIRLLTKNEADDEAINVFTANLRQLLMAPPLGAKNVLGIDPGFRTGCKVVSLNTEGKFLQFETIFPNQSEAKDAAAGETLRKLCKKYNIDVIAIGNGTASRETESFVRGLKIDGVSVVMVNESGASIYSASEVAREEFPDQDLTVRGAVSIGRRLQDPLAELVKIDAKSIGVGQYQHDVNQKKLKTSLDDVVVSCVNQVGVELNTASKQLLTYVSGLGPAMAQAIINHRDKNGSFEERAQLKSVSGLGDKAFEQAAGFLRIQGAKHPLDRSAVHPESYAVVEQMAQDANCSIADMVGNTAVLDKIDLDKYVTDTIGLPTLRDIKQELAKPGRDPRDQFEVVQFDDNVHTLDDVQEGMVLPGVVTNLTNFGAFVDIGVHHDGLVHISEITNKFIKAPADVLNVQQKVDVMVMEIDRERKRIALSMKQAGNPGGAKSDKKPSKGKPKKESKPEAPARKLTEKDLASSLDLFSNRNLQKSSSKKRKEIYKS